ncbi:PEPxxWA-CTERM sorting domain-containing protein [Sphingobium sp. CR28]|uniref:PEPxxWA-CTERM sorting domain-containing protein n=1 Tax=Sphingobium sp. CR28 TaxID=3400272 RepID=UPI003FEE83FE
MMSRTAGAISYMPVGYGFPMLFFVGALATSAPANAAALLNGDFVAAPDRFSQVAVPGQSEAAGSFVRPEPKAPSKNGFDSIEGVLASVSAIPEPDTWSLMVAGFGLAGLLIRRRVEIVSFS